MSNINLIKDFFPGSLIKARKKMILKKILEKNYCLLDFLDVSNSKSFQFQLPDMKLYFA